MAVAPAIVGAFAARLWVRAGACYADAIASSGLQSDARAGRHGAYSSTGMDKAAAYNIQRGAGR